MGVESTEATADIDAAISELEDVIHEDENKQVVSREEVFAKTAADQAEKEFLSSQLNNYQVIMNEFKEKKSKENNN